MTAMLKVRKRTYRMVPVPVESFRWVGIVTSDFAKALPCSACGHLLGGDKPFGIAFVRDGNGRRSMRLCHACGTEAEKSVEISEGK